MATVRKTEEETIKFELELQRRKRAHTRRVFMRSIREIEQSTDVDSIGVEFQYLCEKLEELKEFDKLIKNMTIDTSTEEKFQEEFDECESYVKKFYSIKAKIERMRKDVEKVNKATTSQATESYQHRRNIKLPQIELIKFDDNPKTWLAFWGQFRKIDEEETLEPEDKFQYLIQAMKDGSKARELVTSYPPSGQNYKRALEQLKGRFAREETLIETYVRELLGLVLCQARGKTVDIRSLYDQLMTYLYALESLKVTKEKYEAMLYPLVESALPENILIAWNRSKIVSDVGQLTQLLDFLKREAEAEERIRLTRSNFDHYSFSSSIDVPPTAACIVSQEEKITPKQGNDNIKDICYFCENSSHSILQCNKGYKMSLDQKKTAVKDKGGCFICLRRGHIAKNCKTFIKCMSCGKRHLVILCPDLHKKDKQKDLNEITTLFCKKGLNVILQALIIEVSHEGKTKRIRALCDTGSQRSYIRKSIVQELGFKIIGNESLSHTLFSGTTTPQELYNLIEVNVSSLDKSFTTKIVSLEIENICGFLPKVDDPKIRSKLRELNITVNDIEWELSDIDMLIGADYLGTIYTNTVIQLEGSLVAVKTKFGWTLQGPYCSTRGSLITSCINNTKLSDLWDLEILGISDSFVQIGKDKAKEEVLCKFDENIKFNGDRYEVGLLWKDGYPEIGNNYSIAYKRLLTTTKKLERTNNLLSYNDVFQNWLEDSIIERTKDNTFEGHFLPHHAVIKMSSATTKVRPVFDASCKDEKGLSLNDCIEPGTNLIELIPKLLINFRKGAYGVTSDIKQAFLQILIKEEDRRYLKFLWWDNPLTKEKLITYRHKRVVFGVTCSPFLLAATINYHLNNVKGTFTQSVEVLKRSFYVDNCVASFDTKESLFAFIKEAKEIMVKGGFDLRCWVSAPVRVDETVCSQSVLGVQWNTITDELQCSVRINHHIPEKITKRHLLSLTQQIFDPIGFLAPITLIPKLLIQKAWIDNVGWDQDIRDDLKNEFKIWLSTVYLINECKLPRTLSDYALKDCRMSLHIFCDASIDAYAGCVFLRAEYQNKVTVRLVMAKNRVAPIKRSITLPRLELMGALIASRLLNEVVDLFYTNTDRNIYCWTDSAVVLAWITRQHSWKPFVSNRVQEICTHTKKENWRHVPGDCNPADVLSRGCSARILLETRWWDGPTWLMLSENQWPSSSYSSVDENVILTEAKKDVLMNTNINTELFSNRLLYFSKYSKIVRVVAWMIRWRYGKENNYSMNYINNDEFQKAEFILIKLIQKEHFENRTKLNKRLYIYTDSNNIMRVKTRLGLGTNDADFVSPIILPGKNNIVRRLVEEKHIQLKHAGSQTLMLELRNKFWITSVRWLSKDVVKKCTICLRYKSKHYEAPEAPLPVERMEGTAAFQVTGIDLAGPLFLRDREKCWIVLFTCATFRAVHFELVESLSTNSFVMSLRRFIARRGRVEVIFTDNGTNFQGTANLLKSVDWQEVESLTTIHAIKWRFNPPGAPWWGGWWERLVRLLKEMLRRILGRQSLTWIELCTVLCDCEAVINSRPLTYVSTNTEDLKPLSPMVFLHGLPTSDTTDLDCADGKNLNIRYRYLQKLREDFRVRFRREYLALLTSGGKEKRREMKKGDVVLVGSDAKRLYWPLGLIIELFTGADGFTRLAKVRTRNGEKLRACQSLYPLEITNDSRIAHEARIPMQKKSESTVHECDYVHDSPSLVADGAFKTTRSGRRVQVPSRYEI